MQPAVHPWRPCRDGSSAEVGEGLSPDGFIRCPKRLHVAHRRPPAIGDGEIVVVHMGHGRQHRFQRQRSAEVGVVVVAPHDPMQIYEPRQQPCQGICLTG